MTRHCSICRNDAVKSVRLGLAGAFLKPATLFPRLALALCVCLLGAACAAKPVKTVQKPEAAPETRGAVAHYARVWQPLANRLARDGIYGPEVEELLASLGPAPTQAPMGRKMRELYNRQFFPRASSAKKQPYYKGVVTEANAALCREYIREHRNAFAEAQERYGVSPAIASSLLFVETRLGKVLGDIPENAFYTLASMAISTKPADISEWLAKMPGQEKHEAWIRETMAKRADWAYTEVRALVRHMLKDGIKPSGLPGSIYGAVGLCQFMPSNISVYGADGDGDGRVDLFTPADAIFSLANYLARHGWKAGLTEARQHKLLMTYNHSTVYANTILALSRLVEGKALPQAGKQAG